MITVAEIFRENRNKRLAYKGISTDSAYVGANLQSALTEVHVLLRRDGRMALRVLRQGELLVEWSLDEPDPPEAAAHVISKRITSNATIRQIASELGKPGDT